jgi:putative tricarboxylic transport membrane protein
MKRLDLISATVLFSLAVVLVVEMRDANLWGPMGPAEGFFTLLLCILLSGLSMIVFIKAWLSPPDPAPQRVLGPLKGKLFCYTTVFVLFALALAPLGYTLTMILYLIALLQGVEKIGWRPTIITVLVAVILSYAVFVKFLGISLPEGVLTPVADALRELSLKGS